MLKADRNDERVASKNHGLFGARNKIEKKELNILVYLSRGDHVVFKYNIKMK